MMCHVKKTAKNEAFSVLTTPPTPMGPEGFEPSTKRL